MVHRPDIKSVFGPNKLVPNDRQSSRKAVGNQNLTPGRYNVNEEMKNGTQRAISKRQATPVIINPDKPDAIGKTYN